MKGANEPFSDSKVIAEKPFYLIEIYLDNEVMFNVGSFVQYNGF
jgi:hypothetical protein